MSTLEVNKLAPLADNGTVTLGDSGDTITIPSGVTITNNGTQTGFGGSNAPAFTAYLGSAQTGISDSTEVKVNINTEVFDTDNAYDNSTNYRFTPQVAGKYFVYASVHNKTDTNSSQATSLINIYKNGSVYKKTFINFATNYARLANIDISAVIDMNGSSDYIEIYGRIDTVVSSNRSFGSGEKRTYFGAYKILT